MKKFLIVFILIGLLIPSTVLADSTIDQYTKANREEFLRDIDKHFPRILYQDTFDDYWEEESFDMDEKTLISRYQNNGKFGVTYLSSPPVEKRYDSWYLFYTDLDLGSLSDFAFHIDASITDEYPEGTGGCFIQYSDRFVVGKENSHAFQVLLGYDISKYAKVQDETFEEKLLDISEHHEIGKMYAVDIIRLNGTTYVYLDGEFMFEHVDGFDSRFTWFIGLFLLENGEEAKCHFDSMIVRRK